MATTLNSGVIELKVHEIAAYWWTKKIKNVAEQFNSDENIFDLRKMQFGQVFDYERLKNKGYRQIYLHLSKRFEEALVGRKRYSVRTYASNKGHDELNKWLSEVMGQEIPNINICEQGGADTLMTISLGEEGAMVFVGDTDKNGIRFKLTSKYKPNSVLCEPKKKNNEEEVEPQ